MESTRWKRGRKVRFLFHVKIGFVLGAGLLYAWWAEHTSLMVPCWFRRVTGWACPGCGMTHFCLALLHGNFAEAAQQNWAAAFLLLLWLFCGLIAGLLHPAVFRQKGRGWQFLIWGSVVFLVIFGILRNLPGFSFLLPLYLR